MFAVTMCMLGCDLFYSMHRPFDFCSQFQKDYGTKKKKTQALICSTTMNSSKYVLSYSGAGFKFGCLDSGACQNCW
jgi:hypothetical protein